MATLASWLARLEPRTPRGNFVLGLERIERVARQLKLALAMPVITVAGTNGKGSVCRYLEAILVEAGYRPGCFYSPHLLDFNERIRIAGAAVAEAELVATFAAVEAADAARGAKELPLSYFEFVALAAAARFSASGCNAVIFEVGLGGRLDAVNAFDCDVAVISSIGIDHVEHLGPDRESIGKEKAGILRPGRPVVIGDVDPPQSVLAAAATLGCPPLRRGKEFRVEVAGDGAWNYRGRGLRAALPRPAMPGRHQYANAACALAALEALDARLPLAQAQVRLGIANATLRGRFEVLDASADVPVVLDVAHNPNAMEVLAEALFEMGYFAKTHAVFAARSRKDSAAMVANLARRVDHWHLAPVPGDEGVALAELAAQASANGQQATVYPSVAAAAAGAHARARKGERIVVCGSFLTVEAYLRESAGWEKGQLRRQSA